MKKKANNKSIFSDNLWEKIIIEGTLIGILTLFIYSLGKFLYGLEVGRTMAFLTLGFLELVHSLNVRSDESIFKIGVFSNMYLIGAILIGVVLQIVIIINPILAKIFKVVNLNFIQYMSVLFISLVPIFVIEIQKKINKKPKKCIANIQNIMYNIQ